MSDVEPSALKVSEALAAFVLSLLAMVLAAPMFTNMGMLGIVLMQLFAFALPALLMASSRAQGWQSVGWRSCKTTTLLASAAIGCSLWYWNAHWVTRIGVDWASAEQTEAWAHLLDLQSRAFIVSLLVFALVPAICEELLFRGVIATSLARRIGFLPGLLLSSLLFALIHFNLARLLPITVLGLATGYVRLRSGSLFPAVLLHFLYNACLLTAAMGGLALTGSIALASVVVTTIAAYTVHNSLQLKNKSKK